MIDLPSDCALVAVKACYELARSNVTCRALAITYSLKPKHRHIVTVFSFEDRLRVYDREGSTTLPKQLRWESNPTKIARAWAETPNVFPYKAIRGEWY